MSRISYRRASPENWELTIRRMVSLNQAVITPENARAVLKYLADNQGLAPDEARPAMFDAERRLVDYTYTADKDTHDLCSKCHSMGRVISERRTADEWGLLLSMHRGFYPLVDSASGGFRRTAPPQTAPSPDGRPPDNRQPMEKALAHLPKAFPLHTPEWSAWSAAMHPPRLAGRWAVSGYAPGRGAVFGEVVITDDPARADGAFITETRLRYGNSEAIDSRTGRATIYTGFQWRGRSSSAPGPEGEWREVGLLERDGQTIRGRWFTGAYDETGVDVTLRRVLKDPILAGTSITAVKTPTKGATVRVFGLNLPERVAAADIDFGQGITVTRVVSATPEIVTLEVDVADGARVGPRDLSVAGAVKQAVLVVYDRMDGIRVTPQSGLARLGGAGIAAKQVQQFEAIGFNNGADGKPNTPDDLNLGPVAATWSVEEYAATFADDDVQYVGELTSGGLFIPALDGPNPKRSGNRNNVGDVWVVASFTPPGPDSSAKVLRARAHLLVTVPLYMNWSPKIGSN
jgi:quinohemoprotein amine dehydrogenase